LFPELATYEEDGTTIRGFKYDKLPILLTKAIQEQQAEIAGLQLSLNSLGLINGTSTAGLAATSGNVGIGTLQWLTNALRTLGLALQDGVASLKGVVAETMTSKNIDTERICVSSADGQKTCLDRSQLDELIRNAGSSSTIMKTNSPVPSDAPATTTEAISNNGAAGLAASSGNLGSGMTTKEISPEQAAVTLEQITAEIASSTNETVQ